MASLVVEIHHKNVGEILCIQPQPARFKLLSITVVAKLRRDRENKS